MKKTILTILLGSVAFYISGQTTREEMYDNLNKTGGVYYAYPVNETANTLPPKGYKPFYISHYGRHGSRYLISDNDYIGVSRILNKAKNANALTPLGLNVLSRLDSLMIETTGRGGDLSPLGVRQHRGIAERMFNAYPEVFKGETPISARSTTVVRCVLSMDAFCERLKELNPKLKTTRESSGRYMDYMNYHSDASNAFTSKEWKEEYRKFEDSHTNPDRITASIFCNQDFVRKHINPHEFMWSLYWLASDSQNVETKIDFYDLFTPEELFALWQCFNYRFYACDSNYAGNYGLPVANAVNLLNNIIDSADEAVESGSSAVTLRFGHDGNLLPLAAILRLENCYNSVENPEEFYKYFSDWKIAPMAGNIQIIFFRKDGKVKNNDDILVKFMLNEREIAIPVKTNNFPFYKWKDVRNYYTDEIIPYYQNITYPPLSSNN